MTIVVEDGSIVAGANSYGTIADFRTYATQKDLLHSGSSINVNDKSDDEIEAALIEAKDYIEAKGEEFQGYKVSDSQPLQWPRNDVWVDKRSRLLSNSSIPREVEYAQYALAYDAFSVRLMPTILPTETGRVVSEKVGPIETVYDNSNPRRVSAFAEAEKLLFSLYDRKFALVR